MDFRSRLSHITPTDWYQMKEITFITTVDKLVRCKFFMLATTRTRRAKGERNKSRNISEIYNGTWENFNSPPHKWKKIFSISFNFPFIKQKFTLKWKNLLNVTKRDQKSERMRRKSFHFFVCYQFELNSALKKRFQSTSQVLSDHVLPERGRKERKREKSTLKAEKESESERKLLIFRLVQDPLSLFIDWEFPWN